MFRDSINLGGQDYYQGRSQVQDEHKGEEGCRHLQAAACWWKKAAGSGGTIECEE